jgi:hypothetical protein
MNAWRTPALTAMVAATVAACATCAGRIPLPKQYAVANLDELVARMRAAAVSETVYTAEVRLTYFGPKGRVKATASLAVKRPASLRYEVQGPHGGVLAAFATNGRELQLADLGSQRFFHGPATAHNIDELLGIARLGFAPEAWVALLFGEISLPEDAELSYDDREGVFVVRWPDHRVTVDPESARVVQASVSRGEEQISLIEVRARDPRGLATELRLRVFSEETDVAIRLRDVVYGADLDDSVFVLDPPRNFTPEYLGPGITE